MTAFLITASQLAVLSVLFLIGYFIASKNFINNDGIKGLSFALVSISAPATIFNSLRIDYSPESLKTGGFVIFSYAFVMIFGCFLAFLFAKALRITGSEQKLWLASGMMFNCFFIGAPITRALYGEMSMFYLCFGLLAWNLITYTLVVLVFTGKPENMKSAFKRIFTTPAVIACIASFAFYVLQIKMPTVVSVSVEYLAQMTTPLSMLVFGAISAGIGIKEIFSGKNVYIFSLLRLIIIPLVLMPIFKLCPLPLDARNTIVIGSAMPVATFVPVFAEMYGENGAEGSRYCIVSSVLSLISLPLISAALSAI